MKGSRLWCLYDSLQQSLSNRPLAFGLLSFIILLVRGIANKLSRENGRVCLDNNPVRITGAQTGNGHVRVD